MARPIWSGSISFGLVNVPVKLFSATSPKEVRFHMLHDKAGGRIQQKRVCSIDGEEVAWEHIVKGFEVSKGRYVPITREELEAFAPKATRSIDIEDFVDLAQIDPIYYDHSYYLVPDRGAARPYALLREAMKSTGKVGIGQFVLRTKQYLAAVRPMGSALALSTMLHADEVVDQSELEGLPGADAKPREKELHMARQLVLVNLDKVLYPQAGFTKAQVIDYYARISGALLPHLRDRPLTLKRYPDGVEQPYFYEKRCPSHRPPWVRTAEVDGVRFCLV